MQAKGKSQSNTMIIILVIVGVVGVMAVVCGGVLVALLLPALQAGRQAAQRVRSGNELKQIGLALHNYNDTFTSFPAVYISEEDGSPRTSWRASLLPFVEMAPLSDRYNFNVAWNHPENSAAISEMVPTYLGQGLGGEPNHTNFFAITGPGTVFEEGKFCRFQDIRDGTSNTIVAVMVTGRGVPWAQPTDVHMDELPALAEKGPLPVLFADGSVQFLAGLTPEQWKALATRAGQEDVSTLR